MPKRVYAYPFDPEAGERDGRGCRVFTHRGEKIPFVQRVELDDDADKGLATVTAVYALPSGQFVIDPTKNDVCKVEIRTWVRVFLKGQPDPEPTPDAVLWDVGGGRVSDVDPAPQVPFTTTQDRA